MVFCFKHIFSFICVYFAHSASCLARFLAVLPRQPPSYSFHEDDVLFCCHEWSVALVYDKIQKKPMKFWLVHLGKSFVFIASSQNKTILFQSMQKQHASYVVKKSLTVYLYQAYSTHRRSCMNHLIHTHKKR